MYMNFINISDFSKSQNNEKLVMINFDEKLERFL